MYIRKSREHKGNVAQKLLGMLAISISIMEFVLAHYNFISEGGVFIIMLPLGLYALFTRENILSVEED